MFWDYCIKEDLEETRGVCVSAEATPDVSLPWLVLMGDLEIDFSSGDVVGRGQGGSSTQSNR